MTPRAKRSNSMTRSPEAHAARALALAAWKWTEAEPEFRHAIELNPNNASAHYFYALTYLAPRSASTKPRAIPHSLLSLDPLSSIVNTNYALILTEAQPLSRVARGVPKSSRARSQISARALQTVAALRHDRQLRRRRSRARQNHRRPFLFRSDGEKLRRTHDEAHRH